MDLVSNWKRALYARASARPEELAVAAHALLGGPPDAEGWAEFLDFFCLEWVDAEGFTEAEHAAREGALPGEVARWSREVRTALWVVDDWAGERVLLRDVATEDEIAVTAPGAEADLPKRCVLKARVIPVGDAQVFSGEPAIYGPMGVIARMDLLRAWAESPEPALLERLAELRAAFVRQREERAAFVAHFGADTAIFADARDMERRLATFVSYLLNEHRYPSLGGATRAEAFRRVKGEEPKLVQLAIGPTLTGPGRPGAIYDEVEGIHFLPALGEFAATMRGEAWHPGIVRAYLEDPGVTTLPFRRFARPDVLARILDVPETTLDALLAPHKDVTRRTSPSVLPGLED